MLRNQFDAGCFQRRDELHQGIDIAADHTSACLHTLDGREGEAAEAGKRALVDAEEARAARSWAPEIMEASGVQLCE